jgi:hypothetical protein
MSITLSESISVAALVLALIVMLYVIFVSSRKAEVVTQVGADASEPDVASIVEEFTGRLRRLEDRIVDQSVRLEIAELRERRMELGSEPKGRGRPVEDLRVQQTAFGKRVRVMKGSKGVESTELKVLMLLRERPSITASEVERQIGRTREHTARLMNLLFVQGLVARDAGARPYVYSITEAGERFLESSR